MVTMRRNRARLAACATLAAFLGLAGVVAPAALPEGSPGLTAAQAVPYKMPAGTWGATTYYHDQYGGCVRNTEWRYRVHHRMYWNGTKWYNAVYYRGSYWTGRYCGWT